MARVLITGAAGFAAFHLVNYLGENHQIFGFDRRAAGDVGHLTDIDYRRIELNDAAAVTAFFREVRPDYIFHLAAISSAAESWKQPEATYQINVMGQLNVLRAAVELKSSPRIMIACSSHEYGAVTREELPLTEEAVFRPDSPYAASKVFQDILGLQFFLGYKLPVVRSRSFNHTGPAQSSIFVCSDFAKQIAEAEAGLREPEMVVGNLDARRDFTDVRDVVRAYWMIAEKGRAGEAYNVCSGLAYSAGEILNKLLKLSNVEIAVRVDPEKNRPSDIPVLVGENKKIREEIGWEPEIPFDRTLAELLDWWRGRVGKGRG